MGTHPIFESDFDCLTDKMGDRYNIFSQMEHLQSKYVGTGHADTTKWEWMVNAHRDSYASYIGHPDVLSHIAIAENECRARVQFNVEENVSSMWSTTRKTKVDGYVNLDGYVIIFGRFRIKNLYFLLSKMRFFH